MDWDGDVRDLLAVGLLGVEGRPRHGSDAVDKKESGSNRELHFWKFGSVVM